MQPDAKIAATFAGDLGRIYENLGYVEFASGSWRMLVSSQE